MLPYRQDLLLFKEQMRQACGMHVHLQQLFPDCLVHQDQLVFIHQVDAKLQQLLPDHSVPKLQQLFPDYVFI